VQHAEVRSYADIGEDVFEKYDNSKDDLVKKPRVKHPKIQSQDAPASAEVISLDVDPDLSVDVGKRAEGVDVSDDAKTAALNKVALATTTRKKTEEERGRLAAEEAKQRPVEEDERHLAEE
jgi:hypothetical protein